MEKKHMSFERRLEESVASLRTETPPDSALESGFVAMEGAMRPVRSGRRRGLLSLTGALGTLAVLALATWPRQGQGLAWANVVNHFQTAPVAHETVSYGQAGHDLKVQTEFWMDHDKFAKHYMHRIYDMWTRFDGTREYYCHTRAPYGEIHTVTAGQRSGPYFRPTLTLMEDDSLETFLKKPSNVLVAREETKLSDGRAVTRYRIKILPSRKYEEGGQMNVFVLPGRNLVVRCEYLTKDGKPSTVCDIDYPESIPDAQFKPLTDRPVYDEDVEKEQLVAQLRKGLGTIECKGVKANIRAVVATPGKEGFMTVLWQGASPNGEMSEPIKVVGVPTRPTFGDSDLTTSRVLPKYNERVRNVPKSPLGGAGVMFKQGLPDRVTLQIPIYTQDPSKPIKDKNGKVLGYRSKFVGYGTLRDVTPLKIMTIRYFNNIQIAAFEGKNP